MLDAELAFSASLPVGNTRLVFYGGKDIIRTTPAEWSFMSAEAHYRLGALLEPEDTAAAKEHYQTAISSCPTHALAHNDLAILYLQQGEQDLGIRHLQHAIWAAPDYIPARKNLALALRRKHQTH